MVSEIASYLAGTWAIAGAFSLENAPEKIRDGKGGRLFARIVLTRGHRVKAKFASLGMLCPVPGGSAAP